MTLTGESSSVVTFTAPSTVSTNNNIITLEHTVTPVSGTPVVTTHTVNLVSKDVIVQRDINAFTGSKVILHADGTDDTNYVWSQLSGPTVSLTGDASKTATFTAPNSTSTGKTITIQNIATTDGSTAQPEVIVYVVHLISPPPPLAVTATTGTAKVLQLSQVSLHSSAAGGTPPYTYNWDEVSGLGVTLDLSNPEAPTFSAPVVSSSTPIEFELTVTDANGVTETTQVSLVIEPSLIALSVSPNPEPFQALPLGCMHMHLPLMALLPSLGHRYQVPQSLWITPLIMRQNLMHQLLLIRKCLNLKSPRRMCLVQSLRLHMLEYSQSHQQVFSL